MSASGHSLEIVAVGLGQGGGNIAAEFHRRGYRGLAFNTAQTDLSALGNGRLTLPDSQRVYIGLEGNDGTGGDPDHGRDCIQQNVERIRDAVAEHASGADAIVICAGLGGGTGSCVAEFLQTIADLELPTVTLTTLPHDHESGIAKVNALRGIRNLAEQPSGGGLLLDNAGLARLHDSVPLDTYFETINREIVEPIDLFNRLNDRESTRALRTLDGEDFRALLLAGGVLHYHTRVLPKLDVDALIECVSEALEKNPIMPHGSQLTDVACLGVVIEASERALAESPFSLYEDAVRKLKQQTGGAAIYSGLYLDQEADDHSVAVRVLCSSRALPKSIGEMLAAAEREASAIQRKVQQGVSSLDLGGLESLRSTTRPSPRPSRSLGVAPRRGAATAPLADESPEPKPPQQPDPPARAPEPAAAESTPAIEPEPESQPESESGPAPDPPRVRSQMDALRRLVVGGAAPEPDESAAPSPAEPEDAPTSAAGSDPSRGRYEGLAKAFRGAKAEHKRLYIARELVAAQRTGEALERFYAVEAMARLDPNYFEEALTDATRDADKHVADLAKRALESIR